MQDYVEMVDTEPPRGMRGWGHYRDELRLVGGIWRFSHIALSHLRVDPLPGGLP
jgi:hypothetical protein